MQEQMNLKYAALLLYMLVTFFVNKTSKVCTLTYNHHFFFIVLLEVRDFCSLLIDHILCLIFLQSILFTENKSFHQKWFWSHCPLIRNLCGLQSHSIHIQAHSSIHSYIQQICFEYLSLD